MCYNITNTTLRIWESFSLSLTTGKTMLSDEALVTSWLPVTSRVLAQSFSVESLQDSSCTELMVVKVVLGEEVSLPLSSISWAYCELWSLYKMKDWYDLLPLLTNLWLLRDIKQNKKLQDLFIYYLSRVWQDFINYLISKVTWFASADLVTVEWTYTTQTT